MSGLLDTELKNLSGRSITPFTTAAPVRMRMRSVFQQLLNLPRFVRNRPLIQSVSWRATLYFSGNEQKSSGVFRVQGATDSEIKSMIRGIINTKLDDYGRRPDDYNFVYRITKLDRDDIQDEKDIPMGETLYIHHNSNIDIKQSQKNCVLIAIQDAIKKKYRTPTFEDILACVDRKVESHNLMTCNELLKVAKVYKLNVLVCNMFNEVIADYCEYRKSARGSLIAFQHSGHLYTIDSKLKKSFRKKVNNNSRWIVDKKKKDKALPLQTTLEQFKDILDKEKKGSYITEEKIHIDDVFNLIKDTGRLFSIHTDDGLYLKKISHRNISIESNPYAKECLELHHKEKLQFGSLTNMTNQMFPVLKKSALSVNGLDIFDNHRMNTPINFCNVIHTSVKESQEYKAFDITKCYTSCLLDIEKFPLYTVFDEPEKFNFSRVNGQIQNGFYYVDTQNSYPLCGRNWYYSELVKYCLDLKILNPFQIKYQFIPQYTQDNELKQSIRNIYKKYPFAKSMINNFIGSLNCKPKDKDRLFITTSLKELACYAGESQGFNTTPSGLHYIKYSKKAKQNCMTNRPLYSAIIDLAKIKIHKLAVKVGGNLLAVKTDCVYVSGNYTIPPLSSKIGGYRIDDSELPYWYLTPTAFKKKYRLPVSKPYALVVKMKHKPSMCINGAAGTGKSYIINNQIDSKYQRGAFTNTAARNIKGSTLHTIFSIKDDSNVEYCKPLVIDEYSMIPEQIYAILLNRKINNPLSELILSGDDRQIAFIPLNIDREDIQLNKPLIKDVSNSEVFKYLCDYNKLQLTECRRADDTFYRYCLEGNYSKLCDQSLKQTLVNITKTNSLRIALNHKINTIFSKDKEVLATIEYEDQIINIVEGSRWIVKESNKKLGLIKNDFYEVKGGKFCNAHGTSLSLSEYKRFELRWGMTVNKVQGATITEDFTIHQSRYMDKRSLYTAVSRATRIGQFKLD